MRYLAININYSLNQKWYYKCNSVADCIQYFNRLGPGHGPKTAIYDLQTHLCIWTDETNHISETQIKEIVANVLKG